MGLMGERRNRRKEEGGGGGKVAWTGRNNEDMGKDLRS